MANLNLTLTVHTKAAQAVMWALYPIVALGFMTPDRAGDNIARFVRVTAK